MVTRPARGDVVAGATVALVLVPQALAYATIAGLEPVHGLYAAAAAPLLAAFVGSSPYLQTGPTAVTSLLTFGALSGLADTGTAAFALLAGALALAVGVIRISLGLLGAGPLAYLMSQPVVVSFTSAAAVLIIGTQVPSLLGAPSDHDNPMLAALDVVGQPESWSPVAMALGVGAIMMMRLGRRISPLFPGALLAVILGGLWSHFIGYEGPVVGDVRLRWQAPGGVSIEDSISLLASGLVIALVGFAEPASVARRYAAEDRSSWEPNREFVGQGLANVAAGMAGGFPVGGSLSRTALNRLCGASTRWSGAITGLMVLALLPFTAVLAPLPLAVLAGLVIASVYSLVEVRVFPVYWRWSKAQFGVAAVTAIMTLALAPRVERGVLLGVAAALAVHLWREFRVVVPATVEGGILHLRPSGVLYFGSVPAVERTINELIRRHPDATRVVLHLDAVGRLDLTGVLMLRDALDDARAAGRQLEIRGAQVQAQRLLERVLGWSD